MFIYNTVKDGTRSITYTIWIELNKPKCYRDGSFYKFNTTYVNLEYVD